MTGPIPDVGDILTWPQAFFGGVIVLAVIVGPQIIGLIQNRGIKKGTDVAAHQLQNNSGASVKDAVDRIETKLTDHIALADQRDADRDARLAELEAAKGKHAD